MKISQYIACLQKLQAEFGDLEMCATSPYQAPGARREVPAPQIAFAKIPTTRERTEKFWSQYTDAPETKGHMLVKI